jgi:Xaa-Pro aminopeptidase
LLDSTELVPTSNAVEALREVKDEAEIALMERAAAIADAALYEVLPLMSEGATEEQFALALDSAMRRGGAEGTAFETIVAAGENSAMPHHRPGSRPIRQGDAVVVDFGATYEGYRSDMTRTFCVGVEPEGDMARVFAVVGASQAAGAAAVRPIALSTARVMAWASTSMRPRRSANWALLSWLPVSLSPSSPVSTSPAKVACASKTPWW